MLDLSRLENVKHSGNKLIAACPACRAEEHDRSGNHLAIFTGEDGSFETGRLACIKHEGDSNHRKAIFSFIGTADKGVVFDDRARREYATKMRERERIERERVRLTNHIHSNLEKLLSPYISDSWRAELFARSPMSLDCIDAMPHDFLKCMFPQDAILWMGGDEYDSGSPEHRANFKTCKEWLELEALPPRIAPAHFREGSFRRTNENIIKKPFIIIECDEIIGKRPSTDSEREHNKQLTSALAGYAIGKLGMDLRAVIDSGNKSLHLWFDRPQERDLRTLEKMINGLRIDESPFYQSNIPLRMPHCIHDKTNQTARLLYLNHISQNESI